MTNASPPPSDAIGGGAADPWAHLLDRFDGVVTTDPAVLAAHAGDAMVAGDGGPRAVALPRTTEEVSALLRACHGLGVAVVTQGGLTGYSGGATPTPGTLALSLRRMTAVAAVDVEGATVEAEAGATLHAVHAAAEAAGLMVPVDLGARGSCTIGGITATNAGGNRVLRYGMTRDMVLGLEAVLADGTVIDARNTMLKNNTGYDLKQLFIGSEGTLGVITRVVCRLVPRPASMCAALCGLRDYDAVMRLLRHARSRLGTGLSGFEVMWPDFYDVAVADAPPPLAGRHGIYVLFDLLGTDQDRDQADFEAVLASAFEEGIVEDAAIAQTVAQAEALWAVREAPAEFNRTFGARVPFDISIPTKAIGTFVTACRGELERSLPGARCVFFGHVADSNLHIAVALADTVGAQAVKDVIYPLVGAWRGSISAEHGIGLVKKPYLHLSRTPGELATMRLVKAALDPSGLLNPGKLLPD